MGLRDTRGMMTSQMLRSGSQSEHLICILSSQGAVLQLLFNDVNFLPRRYCAGSGEPSGIC